MDNSSQKNSFSWGNFDYSNLPSNINKKIQSESSNHENNKNTEESESKIKSKIINPIKSKVNQGINKIQSTEIYTKISNKFSKDINHSANPCGIVITKENGYLLNSKITEKENYMREMEKKEQSSYFNSNFIEHDKETGLPIVSEYQLSCVIDEFKDRVIGKEHVIFYKLELFSSITGKRWDIFHNFSEFSDLYLIYSKYFINVSKIDFGKFKPEIVNQPLVHRKLISKLNIFINEIIKKPALISSRYLIKFLKLENHYKDISLYSPILLYDSHSNDNENVNKNNFNINTVFYLEDPKLLFVGTGNNEQSFSKNIYNNMWTKINKLFSSHDPTLNENENNEIKGKFIIYNIINNNNGEIMFVELKSIDVVSEVIKFEFWYEKNYLCVSLKNGQILLFKIFINEPSSITKEIIEYIGTINQHYTSPLACIINFNTGYTYSFAEYEKIMKICDVNNQNLIKDVNIITNKKTKGFICIDYSISLDFIYAQCDDGTIFFFDIMQDFGKYNILKEFPKFLGNLKNFDGEKDKGKIILLKNSYYLLIGDRNDQNCILSIYLIEMSGEINLVKLREINLLAKVSITNAEINNRNEILISISNGSICIYNHDYNYPEFILDSHYKKVTGFIYIEKQKIIISVSLDKTIKAYQLPVKWPAEFLRLNQQINKLNIVKEIIGETQDIYNNLYSSSYNNYNNSSNNSDKKNYENLWNIGNYKKEDIKINKKESDFWDKKTSTKKNTESEFKNFSDSNIYNNNIKEEEEPDNNDKDDEIKITYPKPEKYDNIDIIFCDDLNGWSNIKNLTN